MASLVLTVIGDDRPGLVSALSAPIHDHGGSWERSQMSRLAGKFAGILLVAVPDARADSLVEALGSLADAGLHVTVERTEDRDTAAANRLVLDLVGADRPGIVSDISALLAGRGVSIDELSTDVYEAPMAGGMLFEAHAVLTAPASADVAEVRAALETLGDKLMVDVEVSDD